MKHKFLQAILFAILCTGVHAQSLKAWNWDIYKLKFKAPDDLDVKKSDSTVFEAGNDNMYLDIYPRRGEQMAYNGLKSSLVKWANDEGLYYQSVNASGQSQPIYISNLNGFWGCAIDGTENTLPVTLLLIVNPNDPTIKFYIRINYQSQYYHDAIAVLQSFTPMGGDNSTTTNNSNNSNTNKPKTTTKPKKKKTSSDVNVF